jgi:hypothetical protein
VQSIRSSLCGKNSYFKPKGEVVARKERGALRPRSNAISRHDAAEVVNVLRQLEPANVDILYAAHRIYSELCDETMLSIAMLAPDSARMHQLMAHELARQAKDEWAIASNRAALKIDPHRTDIHFELAEMPQYAVFSCRPGGS